MRSTRRRGGALLMVLWLSAALSAIAFSVALKVRTEMGRAETSMEGLRAYYLACGAADRALNYMTYGPGARAEGGRPQFWEPGVPLLVFNFPGGVAMVEVIPESSRLSVNRASPEEIFRLLIALGLPPEEAGQVSGAILHWRGQGGGQLDSIYLSRTPSFRAPHASLEQIEELMSVAGITPELFHGGYTRTAEGALMPRSGLRDCLTVWSAGNSPLDINTTDPAVMLALGAPPQGVEALVNLRSRSPIPPVQRGEASALLGPAAGRFGIGGTELTYTLRATARLRRQDGRLSDLRRSVALTVQLLPMSQPGGYRILAWHDNAAGRELFNVWPE
ncbi:MAG: general secretion pathway protein GspK [Candidatus Solibacter usitatus]|nr:general secretion pathway protein GspK [Candidatus Solibacter usitatus]